MKRWWSTTGILLAGLAGVLFFVALCAFAAAPASATADADVAAPHSTLPVTPTWGTQRIIADNSFNLSQEGHAIDGNGVTHIVYGRDHLYHAWRDDQWHVEVVDPAYGVGADASLAIDDQNHLHATYYDDFDQELQYAVFDGTTWQRSVIADLSGGYFYSADIVIDSAGYPHVVYNMTNIVHLWYDGSTWQSEVVESSGGGRSFDTGRISLALDSNDQLHIVYGTRLSAYPDIYSEVHYAQEMNDAWDIETLVSLVRQNVSFYLGASLVLDGADRPHIAYERCWSACLTYQYWDGNDWVMETIDGDGGAPSLILNDEGNPIVAFDGDLGDEWPTFVAVRDMGSWQVTRVADDNGTAALAMSPGGAIQLALQNRQGLQHSALLAGGWQPFEQVDISFTAGLGVDLAFAGDVPHLSYGGSEGIQYATFGNGQWTSETIEATVDYWSGTSLALDHGTGAPCVAYEIHEYPAPAEVKVACRDGAGWSLTTIDTAQYRGNLPAVSLAYAPDPPHTLHVAYSVSSSSWSQIRLAQLTPGGWVTETIASGSSNYADTLIEPRVQIAGSDELFVSYFDNSVDKVMIASPDGVGGWNIEPLPGTGNQYHDLALDGDDRPHVAWNTSPEVVLYALDGGAWISETVVADTGGFVDGLSLVFDDAGQPLIGYRNNDSGGLNDGIFLASKNAQNWVHERVDSLGSLRNPVLATNSQGFPHLAYYDESNGDLKLAWRNQMETIGPAGGTLDALGVASFEFPAGAVTDTVVLSMTLVQPYAGAPTTGLFYDIEALYEGSREPATLAPGTHYNVTIHYDEATVPTTVPESTLALYYWNGADWIREPTSEVDTEANILTATPDHFSLWGTRFEEPLKVFLPLTLGPPAQD